MTTQRIGFLIWPSTRPLTLALAEEVLQVAQRVHPDVVYELAFLQAEPAPEGEWRLPGEPWNGRLEGCQKLLLLADEPPQAVGSVLSTALKQLAQRENVTLFALLLALSASLLLFLNWQTVLLSGVAVLLAAIYPFMKRVTNLPQVVLGAAFSWGMPMSFMAIQGQLPLLVWVLYGANLLWTVAYDTFYAMVDQADDEKIGVKSTARLFGRYGFWIIALLQLGTLALLEFAGSVMVISHDRWFLDRIATHILAAEGDSQWVFFDGNYQEYEADKKRRLGEEGAKPKRVRFKALK